MAGAGWPVELLPLTLGSAVCIACVFKLLGPVAPLVTRWPRVPYILGMLLGPLLWNVPLALTAVLVAGVCPRGAQVVLSACGISLGELRRGFRRLQGGRAASGHDHDIAAV